MSKLLVADPALLSLPPLAAGEEVRTTGEREVEALSAALPAMGPIGFNLFGVHDIRGRGTHVEPSPHADPFIYCVAAKLPPGAKPPFCAHPHCGASVGTILLQGGAIMPWDNVHGREPQPLLPGGLYHVDTGAGCVHDEPLEPLNLRPHTRAGFGEEPPVVPADASAPTMLMQLWWNAIEMSAPEGTPLRPVATQVIAPEQVPRLEQPDQIALRILAGSYRGSTDVATSNAHPVLIMHVRLAPGADGALTPLPSAFNGFAWLLEGAAHIGTASLLVHPGANGLVRLPPGGDTLRLRNASSDEPCTLLVALGQPHRKAHYKYVGYGGGLIHRSVEAVEAAMAEYEGDPKNFGRAAAKAEAQVDMSAYKLVPGFQSDGGEMMERPVGAIARFAYS
jgi:redox-sensitive bicupin YhaK (pirin superfamily)